MTDDLERAVGAEDEQRFVAAQRRQLLLAGPGFLEGAPGQVPAIALGGGHAAHEGAFDLLLAGVLVALKGSDNGIGKQIAMHIAATSPVSLSEADMDADTVARELAVQTAKALEENAASAKPKPEAVIQNNIIPGRMKKFLEEVTLVNQKFVINPDITVAQAATVAGVEILGFVRMAVGEGIEKEKEDFAAEVAKMNAG